MHLIPIMRPKLPSVEQLTPYLRAIDSSRTYSNFGPLVCSFEDRLVEHFGLPGETVTTVANATLGLTLSLGAQGARPGTLCIVPAWTFIASAQAITMAGLVPYFVDVDMDTWALDPDRVQGLIDGAPGDVGAVMPVLPFGRPLDLEAWDQFQSLTGLPVVIDAAAGFDSLRPGHVPAVVSLHATKVFGIGEGGFVVSTEKSIVKDVRARSNFGFMGSREAMVLGLNAKLSEYHAAVGLAALEEWDDARSEWIVAAQAYRDALRESQQVRVQDGFGQSWIASTCVLKLADSTAERTEHRLAQAGIGSRRWWGMGAHAHPASAIFPRANLLAADALAQSTIAVPFFRDLRSIDIQKITETLLAETSV